MWRHWGWRGHGERRKERGLGDWGGLTRSLRVWGRKGKWVDFGGASRACQPRLQSPAVYLAQHSMVTVADTHREFRIWHQISYQDLSDRIDPGQR